MRLTFLGKETQGGGSPTLWATDRGTYVVQGWKLPGKLRLVQETTAAGRQIRRARVVTVPHGDYTRWGLAVAEHNLAAGEDIRWLPRHLIDPASLTTDDFWLFDDGHVVFTTFEPDGRFAGGASTTDPVIAAHCRSVRDQVWRAAIPHSRYIKSEFVSA